MTNHRTIQPDARKVIVGVDTHKHVHVAVAIDTWGIRLGDRFDIPDHLRNRVFRRNRHQHVDVIRQQMPFLHPTLPLLGQTPQHVPQVVPQAAIQGLAAILRDENDVILTLPFRVV